MVKPFILRASEVLLETPIFNVRCDRAVHPESGREGAYYVLEQADWVNVVALTVDGRLILVEQWRHGTRAGEVELPAGIVDPGEGAEEAAARELAEETGYEAASWTRLGALAPNPAIQSNTCHVLLARGCERRGEQRLDAGEAIGVRVCSVAQTMAMVRDGTLRHAMAVAALLLWRAHEGI